jgi:hypothetical protein
MVSVKIEQNGASSEVTPLAVSPITVYPPPSGQFGWYGEPRQATEVNFVDPSGTAGRAVVGMMCNDVQSAIADARSKGEICVDLTPANLQNLRADINLRAARQRQARDALRIIPS